MKLHMHPGSCEDCGGSASWTIIEGVMYYFCVEQCAGFMQIEMNLADAWAPQGAVPDQRGSSRKESQSGGLSDYPRPIEVQLEPPQLPTEPEESPEPESLDQRRFPWQGTSDGWIVFRAPLDDPPDLA